MKYVLIPGKETFAVYGRHVELYLWGMDRHDWGPLPGLHPPGGVGDPYHPSLADDRGAVRQADRQPQSADQDSLRHFAPDGNPALFPIPDHPGSPGAGPEAGPGPGTRRTAVGKPRCQP